MNRKILVAAAMFASFGLHAQTWESPVRINQDVHLSGDSCVGTDYYLDYYLPHNTYFVTGAPAIVYTLTQPNHAPGAPKKNWLVSAKSKSKFYNLTITMCEAIHAAEDVTGCTDISGVPGMVWNSVETPSDPGVYLVSVTSKNGCGPYEFDAHFGP